MGLVLGSADQIGLPHQKPIHPRCHHAPGSSKLFPGATISASLMTRKFKIGQPLLYHPTNRMKARGRFIVIRLFQQPDGKVHYRIRSENDGSLEYTADASELRASVSPRPGGQ